MQRAAAEALREAVADRRRDTRSCSTTRRCCRGSRWGHCSCASRRRVARLSKRRCSAARERAAIGTLPLVLDLIARDQATSDRWRLGEATYREAITLARESDQRTCLAFGLAGLAWLQARQGREPECRANAAEALALAEELGARCTALWSLTALGELELALGRPEPGDRAVRAPARPRGRDTRIRDVDLWPAAGDGGGISAARARRGRAPADRRVPRGRRAPRDSPGRWRARSAARA